MDVLFLEGRHRDVIAAECVAVYACFAKKNRAGEWLHGWSSCASEPGACLLGLILVDPRSSGGNRNEAPGIPAAGRRPASQVLDQSLAGGWGRAGSRRKGKKAEKLDHSRHCDRCTLDAPSAQGCLARQRPMESCGRARSPTMTPASCSSHSRPSTRTGRTTPTVVADMSTIPDDCMGQLIRSNGWSHRGSHHQRLDCRTHPEGPNGRRRTAHRLGYRRSPLALSGLRACR